MQFDLAMTDALLATTRAVRKRLDFEKPVPRTVVRECLELAVQAPTGGNQQGWRWIVVDDPEKRATIAEYYRASGEDYFGRARKKAAAMGNDQTLRVLDSASWLGDNLQHAPVHLIPCLEGRLPDNAGNALASGTYGSIFPAVWSFQLALRARGLGSVLTTLHLKYEREIGELLGIPENVMQVALLPVAYTKGTDFKRASRPPIEGITHWNGW